MATIMGSMPASMDSATINRRRFQDSERRGLIIRLKSHFNEPRTEETTMAKMTREEMDRILNINLKGALLCAKHSVPVLKERGAGSIVFCSSVLNTIGFPQCVVYSATKAGMIGATRTLAAVLAASSCTRYTSCSVARFLEDRPPS